VDRPEALRAGGRVRRRARIHLYHLLVDPERQSDLLDEKAAAEITGGPIAPPAMISVWFRPHHWAPGRTEQALPLQVHFDLKKALDVPEAVMSDNTVTFGEPVRPGDRLRTWQVLRNVSTPRRPSSARATSGTSTSST
jgi:acyl dehydratase